MQREWLGRLGLVIGSLVLMVVVGECSLRWLSPRADFGEDRRLARRYRPYRQLHYRSHFGEFDVRSRYNSLGMRDTEHPVAKPAGTRRIVVIGDSFVEARMIPMKETFTARLGEILSEQGGPVEVLNTGRGGFGSMEEFLVLRHFGMSRDPDLVIQAFFMNDPWDDFEERQEIEWDETGPLRFTGFQSELELFVGDFLRRLPAVWKRRTVYHDRIGDIKRDPFAVLRPGKSLEKDENWSRTLKALEASARLCHGRGVGYLLIVIPPAVQVDAGYAAELDEDLWKLRPDLVTRAPQERLLRFGEERGFAVLDLIPILEPHREKALYYLHDAHWTPAAHEIVARALAELISSSAWRLSAGPVAWPPPEASVHDGA